VEKSPLLLEEPTRNFPVLGMFFEKVKIKSLLLSSYIVEGIKNERRGVL